ncbi:hypothetical protein B4N84_07885 [Flavobacterium sp. IR1]|nr:hypothetical protein B4N84_07885 [Flavobacterium sp. IR1]
MNFNDCYLLMFFSETAPIGLFFRSFFPLYALIFCAEHRHKRISTAIGARAADQPVLFWRDAHFNPIVVLVINIQFLFLKYHKPQFSHKTVIASSQKNK